MTRTRNEPTYKRFITGPFKRFDESNTAFSRAERGELRNLSEVLERGLKTKAAKNIEGYTQEDYALNIAGRAIDTMVRKVAYSRQSMPTRWSIPMDKMPVTDPAKMSDKVKRVARWFGAGLVGICEVNPFWIYSHFGDYTAKLSPEFNVGDPIELPKEYRYAVVIAIEMDYTDVRRSPAVTPTLDLGYSKMAFVAASLADFIRRLGYRAIPAGNDMALSVPLAVDAGLGELGRNGILITEEYGPRVRLCKVFTDLPLETDEPVDLGVQHFCEECKKCAQHCPGQAIAKGERTERPNDKSINPGLLKWPVDAGKCLEWWYKNGVPGCTNCIRVCSWNKPSGLLHTFVRGIIKRTSLFDYILVKGDDLMGYGKQVLEDTPSEKIWGSALPHP